MVLPRRLAVRRIRRAISPRLATSRDLIKGAASWGPADAPQRWSGIVPWSHPEETELRPIWDRRVQGGAEGEAQDVARLQRIDDAVIPESRRGVVGIAFVLVF